MASPTVEQASDSLQKLKLESQNKPSEKTEAVPGHDSPTGKNLETSTAVVAHESGRNGDIHEGMVDSGIYYATNGYGPLGYMYDFSQGGFESPGCEWEEYPRYVGPDGVEIHSGFYGENGAILFHQPGYGYPPQATFGPYSPASQMPTMGADGQLYGPSAFQYHGPFYQQALPTGAPYIPPSVVVSEGPATVDENSQRTDASRSSAPNGNISSSGPRPGVTHAIMPLHGPLPRAVFPLNVQNPGPQDARGGFDGLRGNTANGSQNTNLQPRPVYPRPRPAVSSPPLPVHGHPTPQFRPVTQMQARMPAHPSRPARASSPGLGPGCLGRGYAPLSRCIPNLPAAGRAGRGAAGLDLDLRGNGNGRAWNGDKIKVRDGAFEQPRNGSINDSVHINGHMDVLNEQNRGPRISRMRNLRASAVNQAKDQNGHPVENSETATYLHREQYNRTDLSTSYSDAKFFVIKSYSEDDVHKSIKYQVWASTPNGNKRLDGAYQEAQLRVGEKEGNCPVFLFFSVNASGQFCGVAEMTGPVDFLKSVEYWQQDKWSGQFSVKWHIIKDVPNIQFRHIILENNDNKPVTNSRDTQEVKFEQGIEMLNIFKNYPERTSILDDFQFYDNRQKAMQEKKNRLQSQQVRDGNHVEQGTLEAPLKLKIETGTDVPVNGSAVAVGPENEGVASGSVAQNTDSTTDCPASVNREGLILEPKSDTVQKEPLEASFQRKSYLRCLKEGKCENGSATIDPAKAIEAKVPSDVKKFLVATEKGAET